jgi:MFS family permease
MLSASTITYLLNKKGKKVTILIGCAFLGLSLPLFGEAVYFDKFVFVIVCVVCRLFIGFGSGCISSASNSIIANNYPYMMAGLISANTVISTVGMIAG